MKQLLHSNVIYEARVIIRSTEPLTDQERDRFMGGGRFNSLAAAIAIAVINFNRGDQVFTAETKDIR